MTRQVTNQASIYVNELANGNISISFCNVLMPVLNYSIKGNFTVNQ